jgi:hypothetical protein
VNEEVTSDERIPHKTSISPRSEENHMIDGEICNVSDAEDEAEINEEARMAKVKHIQSRPSEEEVELHMKTHLPYRSWCKHCVKGKAKNDPHSRSKQELTTDIIEMDYAFLTENSDERKERKAKERKGDQCNKEKGMPVLVTRDRRSGKVSAEVVPQKGENPYAV